MTSAPHRDPRARNPGIDLLRGASIVLVVIHHLAIRLPLRKTALAALTSTRLMNALSYNGYEAVFLFFVISGFLITTNAQQRWGDLGALDARAFYARRAARILPCLLALVAVLAALHALGVQDYLIHRAGQSLARAALAAFGLHLNWYEGRTGYLPGGWDVLWSLSIEEVFYLAFPLACLALARTRLFVPALAALALSLPATRAALQGNEIWQEKAYLPGMAAIAAGVLGALLAARTGPWSQRAARIVGCAGAAGIALVLLAEDLLWPLLGNGTILFEVACATALVVACHFAASEPSPRATRWLESFGRLSYECYLTHMFVVFAVVRVWRWTGAPIKHAWIAYLPLLALTWLLGAVVGRFVSAPAEHALRARLETPKAYSPPLGV